MRGACGLPFAVWRLPPSKFRRALIEVANDHDQAQQSHKGCSHPGCRARGLRVLISSSDTETRDQGGTLAGRRTLAAASASPLTTRVISGLLLTPASGPFGSGSARLGLSQKDGLPNRWLAFICCGSRPSTRARGAAYGLLLCMRTYRARSEAKLLDYRNLAVSSRNVLAKKQIPSRRGPQL